MNKPMVLMGLFATILGVLMLFVIIPDQHIAPMMSSVSPDFYPNIGTIILLAGGIGLAIFGLMGNPAPVSWNGIQQAVSFGSLMAVLFGITLLAFAFFNFLVGGAFLVLSTMWLLGERRPLFLVLNTALTPVVIWLFIDVLLGRGLP